MTSVVSPSLPVAIGIELLLALAERGVEVRVDPTTFDLVVTPDHLLSEQEVATIARNYDGVMVAALLNCDAGVRVRRRALSVRQGSNLVVPDAPYEPGVCFSCGADSPAAGRRPTRCWRCRAGFTASVDS